MLTEADRLLANWLSARVITTAEFGILPDPARTFERAAIIRLLVLANRRKVPVVPGYYFARPNHIRWDPDVAGYREVPKSEGLSLRNRRPKTAAPVLLPVGG